MSSAQDTYNKELATRQVEINEWTYNNRMETLFVFQVLFICLLIVAIVMSMKRMGVVGGGFAWYVIILTMLVFSIIVASRSLYTNNSRDKRMWNRRRFADDGNMTTVTSASDMTDYLNRINSVFGQVPKAICS